MSRPLLTATALAATLCLVPLATAGMAANPAGAQAMNAAAQDAAPATMPTDPSAGPAPAQDSQPAAVPDAPMAGMPMTAPPAGGGLARGPGRRRPRPG